MAQLRIRSIAKTRHPITHFPPIRLHTAHTRSVFLLIATALCWSLGGVLIKSIDWPPLAVAGGRGFIAALFLLANAVRARAGQPLDADAAYALGLVTANPDDIDWADELRIAVEERVAMSPDALTGMEANLRFNGPENMFTRVFGRLTAWQNWIFIRPNATGPDGALQRYGTGVRGDYSMQRV